MDIHSSFSIITLHCSYKLSIDPIWPNMIIYLFVSIGGAQVQGRITVIIRSIDISFVMH